MNESFVFHADFIDHLPEELKAEWAMYAVQYGIYGTEPSFKDPLHAELWRKLKDRIDADKQIYNKRVEYLKQYRENKKHLKHSECSSNDQNIQTDTLGVSVSDSVSVSEYVSDSVSVFDSVSESENENVYDANSLSPSQTEYSKQILAIFKEAGLPCARGNEINFLMRDFKNGLAYIHSNAELKGLHSDEVLAACRNYAEVVNDPECYLKTKLDFCSFVKSKHFWKMIPSNFSRENFLDWKNQKSDQKEMKNIIFEKCPKCGEQTMFWSNDTESYYCNNCRKTMTYEEVNE